MMNDLNKSNENKEKEIRRKLLAWYRKNGRDLPWRQTSDSYCIWISEIMLQQTQVDTVIPYYRRFLKRFPDVQTLAASPLEEVLKLWENLGYYSRARHLHAAAAAIVAQHGGRFPDDPKAALKLPGIGAYTAGAILSIAYGKRLSAIDGNVKRVIARLYAIEAPVSEKGAAQRIASHLDILIPARTPGDFNQALMDLGATICLPNGPRCEVCPVRHHCSAFAGQMQDRIPIVVKKKPLARRHAVGVLIRDKKGRVLIMQRSGRGLLAGLWKLPGGFQETCESLTEALTRTVQEETGLTLAAVEEAAAVDHAFTHFKMTLHGFCCKRFTGRVRAGEGLVCRWIAETELSAFAFAKADRLLIKRMLAHCS